MIELLGVLGSIAGIVSITISIITAILSVIYLRRQTLHMESQVDKAIEVKITRELEAPEGTIDTTLRKYINGRLGDVRTQLRQDLSMLSSRVEQVDRVLGHSHIEDVVSLWKEQKEAVDAAKESSSKVNKLVYDIRDLQQAVEDMQNGVGNQAMIRTQIRGIAEQLLRMTGQEMTSQEMTSQE